LYARDRAGNSSPELLFNIILDRTAPVLIGTEPASGAFVRSTIDRVVFNFMDASTALAADETLATARLWHTSGPDVAGNWELQPPGSVVFTPAAALPEDSYTASVRAYDIAGNSVTVSIAFTYDLTPPSTPTLDPVTTPTKFRLQTLTGTKDSQSSIWINGVEVTPVNADTAWSHQVTLTEGSNNFEVYSLDAAGNRSGSAFGIIYYDETAPLPITTDELQIDGSGIGTRIALDWTAYQEKEQIQDDIAEYRVYVSDRVFTRVTDMTPVVKLPAGTFLHTVENLIKGKQYYFAVVAVDTYDNINTSVTPKPGVPADTIPPEEVRNLQVASFETRLIFSWTAPVNIYGDLAGYQVYFNGATEPTSLTADQVQLEFTDLTPATAYDLNIAAVDLDGNQSAGLTITGITLLDNPADLNAQAFSGWVDLSWSAVQPQEYIQHYAVYVSTSDFTSTEGMSAVKTATTTSATIDNLTLDVTYYFAVTTVNLSGGEDKSVVAVAATPQLDETGPEVSEVRLNGDLLVESALLLKAGTFTLQAEDYSGVNRVEFFLDSDLIHIDSDGAPVFTCELDINGLEDKEYPFRIDAYDILGNKTSLEYQILVNKPPPNDCFQECIDTP
jgi:hypothetical protein